MSLTACSVMAPAVARRVAPDTSMVRPLIDSEAPGAPSAAEAVVPAALEMWTAPVLARVRPGASSFRSLKA